MAVRKADVVKTLNRAADAVASQTGRANVVEAICPKYTPTQIATTGIFGEFITKEYGQGSISAWSQAQRDRRKVVRALRRASRLVSEGKLSI